MSFRSGGRNAYQNSQADHTCPRICAGKMESWLFLYSLGGQKFPSLFHVNLPQAHPGFQGAGGGVRGVRPSDPCLMADYGFPRWRLVAAMAGIAHQPVLTMTSLQMINLTSLIDDAKCYE